MERISTSPDDAVRNRIATGNFDVRTLLAQVSVPTLVMHARDDAVVPFDQGRRLAAGIPGAKLVPLEGQPGCPLPKGNADIAKSMSVPDL